MNPCADVGFKMILGQEVNKCFLNNMETQERMPFDVCKAVFDRLVEVGKAQFARP